MLRWLAVIVLAAVILLRQGTPELITQDNVSRLGSVLHLDFEQVQTLGLSTGSGVFVMNAEASIVVTFANAENTSPMSTAIIWDGFTGDILQILQIGNNPYDRAVSANGDQLAVARPDGVVLIDRLTSSQAQVIHSDAPVLNVWFTDDKVICGETAADLNGEALILCSDNRPPVWLFGGKPQDFARIGRVPHPLAVTVSEDGLVSLWDLETGDITAEGKADDIAVFGAINASGTHLVWRDPNSTRLNLLDFATSENQVIAPLEGGYIAHLQLTHQADVIFGIDPLAANGAIWAWITATGERLDLGTYRQCEREQPDLGRLSADGTTLVIGCDTGIDIWRIK
jgi:WD40 repeat protein